MLKLADQGCRREDRRSPAEIIEANGSIEKFLQPPDAREAVGKRIRYSWEKDKWMQVVGVTRIDHTAKISGEQSARLIDASRSRDIVRRMADRWSSRREPCTIGVLQHSPWCRRCLTTSVFGWLLFAGAPVGILCSQGITRYVNSGEAEAVITVL